MFKALLAPVLAGVISTILSSCATVPYLPTAREVKQFPREGGTIALPFEHQSEDRAKADTLMARNCAGQPVKVIDEGEVVVLNFNHGTSEKSPTPTEAVESKEWRINYSCVADVPENIVKRNGTAKTN